MGGPEETCLWELPDYPYQLECALSVLEQIDAEATDAFCSVPRGGAEAGGVLYGRREDSRVRILAAKPLKCEHAFGPSFTLSDSDFERLAAALELPKTDPQFAGMVVVGWYHSHTRNGISLTDADLAIHREFFDERWHIAVVLRPLALQPTQVGVFYRLADGSIIVDGALVKYPVAQRLRVRTAAAGRGATDDEAGVIRAESPKEGEHYRRRISLQLPGPHRRRDASRRRRPALLGKAVPLRATALRHEVPRGIRPERGTAFAASGVWRRMLLALAVCAGLTAAYVAIHTYGTRHDAPAAALNLRAVDSGGQLYIGWDRRALADVVNGVLQIKDGEERKAFAIDRESIDTGWISYARKSELVSVSLTLVRKDGSKLRGYVSYLPGAPSRVPEPAPVAPLSPVNASPPAGGPAAKPAATQAPVPPLQSSASESIAAAAVSGPERRTFQLPGARHSQAHPVFPPAIAPEQIALNKSIGPPAAAAAAHTLKYALLTSPGRNQPSIAGSWTTRGIRSPRPVGSVATGLGSSAPGVQDVPPSGSPYQPKLVDVVIFEKSGEIFGSLVGSYRIPKSSGVDPDVTFTFGGALRDGPMRFPWTAANGGKGEIEFIHLPQSPDAIRIVWYPEGHKPVFDHVLVRTKSK